jgi:hypothetical protein
LKRKTSTNSTTINAIGNERRKAFLFFEKDIENKFKNQDKGREKSHWNHKEDARLWFVTKRQFVPLHPVGKIIDSTLAQCFLKKIRP